MGRSVTNVIIQAIPVIGVTQISVHEEFNMLLLISEKNLVLFHLNTICSSDGGPVSSTPDPRRLAPLKLSKGREVGFFTVSRIKDRTLVIYKRRDGLSSTFKVCPVQQPSYFLIIQSNETSTGP